MNATTAIQSQVIRFREAVLDEAKKEARIVVIRSGESMNNRVYTEQALKQLIPFIRESRKVYIDHLPAKAETNERSLKDWAATVKDVYYENDAILADIAVHDDWLWQRMNDAPNEIGVSIDAVGMVTTSADGIATVSEIIRLNSIDFVTEAAAGGGVVDSLVAGASSSMPTASDAFARLTESVAHADVDEQTKSTFETLLTEAQNDARYSEQTRRIRIDQTVEGTLTRLQFEPQERESIAHYLSAVLRESNQEPTQHAVATELRRLLEWSEKTAVPAAGEKTDDALTALDRSVMRQNGLNPDEEHDRNQFLALKTS